MMDDDDDDDDDPVTVPVDGREKETKLLVLDGSRWRDEARNE
jgi:hypothetical protein